MTVRSLQNVRDLMGNHVCQQRDIRCRVRGYPHAVPQDRYPRISKGIGVGKSSRVEIPGGIERDIDENRLLSRTCVPNQAHSRGSKYLRGKSSGAEERLCWRLALHLGRIQADTTGIFWWCSPAGRPTAKVINNNVAFAKIFIWYRFLIGVDIERHWGGCAMHRGPFLDDEPITREASEGA